MFGMIMDRKKFLKSLLPLSLFPTLAISNNLVRRVKPINLSEIAKILQSQNFKVVKDFDDYTNEKYLQIRRSIYEGGNNNLCKNCATINSRLLLCFKNSE